MATEPLLEFDDLLAPIPGDLEAGEPVPYEVRQQLEEDRREEDPEAYAPDDPMRPEKPKRADWPGIVRKAKETLQQTSKDLLVAARLTEALTKQHGYAGARDGLHLLALLVDQCWDRLNPPIEDGDVEVRSTPFVWLDQSDRGARFPTTLRQQTIIASSEDKFNLLEWKAFQEGRSKTPKEDFEKAILATPAVFCQTNAELLDQCIEVLNALTRSLNEKMGPAAPGLVGVREALENSRTLVKQMLQSKGGPVPAAGDQATAGGEASADGASAGGGRPAGSRAEAYRQLAQAAGLLQQLEPHSPIPYLVQKAVELGALSFPELMKRLIRDANVLGELNRELGIRDDSAAAPSGEG